MKIIIIKLAFLLIFGYFCLSMFLEFHYTPTIMWVGDLLLEEESAAPYTATSSYYNSNTLLAPTINITGEGTTQELTHGKNLHKKFMDNIRCGDDDFLISDVAPNNVTFLPLFEMAYGFDKKQVMKKRRNYFGHRWFKNSTTTGVKMVTKIQICLYETLQYWWSLTEKYNISRWSAHGGTAMSAVCHSSINPWDDDIDITVGSCTELESMFQNGENVSSHYPQIPKFLYEHANKWHGCLIDKDWILIKLTGGKINFNWYKLKPVVQFLTMPEPWELGGMDIMCWDSSISRKERGPMTTSGYRDYLKGSGTLSVLEFGPTFMKIVPQNVTRRYVHDRYNKLSFCDFPYDKSILDSPNQHDHVPPLASQMEVAASKWYISTAHREELSQQIGGSVNGDHLSKNSIPSLNDIEIDNSIASTSNCRIGNMKEKEKPMIKVIDFNAERGRHWYEFAKLIENEKADVIILNEMDIGMARSGNVHTTRKLAYYLKMNYAWGLEFVELTNGNHEEQNRTYQMDNALGLHGNAILSTCNIFDPVIFRDPLESGYFANHPTRVNAKGSEKRLGGRMSLFVKTGDETNLGRQTGHYVVAGAVHKAHPTRHRNQIWEYFGFGLPKHDIKTTALGSPEDDNQLGIIIGGDLQSRDFCTHSGVSNLDKPQRPRTFPADCSLGRTGLFRGDYFCGNMQKIGNDNAMLPCAGENGTLQLSDHSIISISVLLRQNEKDNNQTTHTH